MNASEWILIVIIVVAVVVLVSTLMARRLDRLHRTVVKSRRTLEHALTARAQYAHDFADSGVLDLAGAILLADAADNCLRQGMEPIVDDGLDRIEGFDFPAAGVDRRSLESDLSRTLRLTVDELGESEIPEENREIYEKLQRSRLDVKMTRSFHNNHVAQISQVRRAPLASVLRLAGNAPAPATVDMDDE